MHKLTLLTMNKVQVNEFFYRNMRCTFRKRTVKFNHYNDTLLLDVNKLVKAQLSNEVLLLSTHLYTTIDV